MNTVRHALMAQVYDASYQIHDLVQMPYREHWWDALQVCDPRNSLRVVRDTIDVDVRLAIRHAISPFDRWRPLL